MMLNTLHRVPEYFPAPEQFDLVPGQTVEPDPVHNLALRPGGRVDVIVKRR